MGMLAVGFLYNGVYDSYQLKKSTLPETIMEILTKNNPIVGSVMNVFGTIALFMIIIQLTSVLPVLCYFNRRQFYGLIGMNQDNLSNTQFYVFNNIYNLSCLAWEIFAFDPSKFISVIGALGGFTLIYVIPIFLHLKCLYYTKRNYNKSISPSDEINEKKESLTGPDSKEKEVIVDCLDHSKFMKDSKTMILAFYGFILIIGVAVIVIQGFNFF